MSKVEQEGNDDDKEYEKRTRTNNKEERLRERSRWWQHWTKIKLTGTITFSLADSRPQSAFSVPGTSLVPKWIVSGDRIRPSIVKVSSSRAKPQSANTCQASEEPGWEIMKITQRVYTEALWALLLREILMKGRKAKTNNNI